MSRLELVECGSCPPWPRNPGTAGLAERYIACAERRGLPVQPAARGGVSDANHAAAVAPTLDGLGIVGGDFHSPHEWADLATLDLRATIAADLLGELCARGQRLTGKDA